VYNGGEVATLRLFAACLLIVAAIALLAPWDPGDSGGWGARAAFAVFVAGALIGGWTQRGASVLAIGATFGFLALVVFGTGAYLAYDLGMSGVEWSDWGDQNHPVALLAFAVAVWGLPAAIVGAVLALLGSVGHRLGTA
jgi:hypothetical protein